MEITSINTNTLAREVYGRIIQDRYAFEETSRNGPVRRFKEPVSVCLTRPWERVNFSAVRDANPFFHLIEAMAMLAGHNSVKLMSYLTKSMAAFSDDGVTYNAFYGTRARKRWGDQLTRVINELKLKKDSRQCVVQLWSPRDDLYSDSKDKACNLCFIFSVVNARLSMTTYNRSNDAVLGGVTGANIVHLSFFQQYVADSIGLPPGCWWHVSNNLHVYTDQPQWKRLVDNLYTLVDNPYNQYAISNGPFNVLTDKDRFDTEVAQLMVEMEQAIDRDLSIYNIIGNGPQEPFLKNTVVPMFEAWQLHRACKNTSKAIDYARQAVASSDWKLAAVLWLQRRENPSQP